MYKNTVYVNTVYWEGGETYRPFVTVKTPKQWPTAKMAFYQSTGTSNNDGKNEYRKYTWFPTLGLLQTNSTLYDDLNKGEDGYILKQNVFSKIFKIQLPNWFRAILTKMLFKQTQNLKQKYLEFYYQIPEFLRTRISPDKELGDEVIKVDMVFGILAKYCQYWWQVQISAQLGGGLWEKVPEFRDFVLSHDYDDYTPKFNYTFTKRSSSLTLIKVEYNVDTNAKDDATKVMDVLIKEHAILIELLYGDYKEHKLSLLDHFKNGISLSKQRKSKSRSRSPSETKDVSTKKRKRSPTKTKSTRKRV